MTQLNLSAFFPKGNRFHATVRILSPAVNLLLTVLRVVHKTISHHNIMTITSALTRIAGH